MNSRVKTTIGLVLLILLILFLLVGPIASVRAESPKYRGPANLAYQANQLIKTSSFQRYSQMMPRRPVDLSMSWGALNSTGYFANAAHPVMILPEWYQQYLMDMTNDYVVQWAEPVDGQYEYVVDVRYPGESEWTRLHRMGWCGSVDHGSPCDQGEYVFGSWFGAFIHARNLLQDGEIDDYEIVVRPKPLQWQTLATFDRRSDAEAYAENMAEAADLLGQPRQVRILTVPE